MPFEYSIRLLTCAIAEQHGCAGAWLTLLLKIAYVLMYRIPGLVALLRRGDRAKDAELLLPRHENAVLRRQARRGRLRA